MHILLLLGDAMNKTCGEFVNLVLLIILQYIYRTIDNRVSLKHAVSCAFELMMSRDSIRFIQCLDDIFVVLQFVGPLERRK